MLSPEPANSLNTFAERLERKTLDLIESGQWDELDAMIAPECQFVTRAGVFDKAQAMALMQGMALTSSTLKDVKATVAGDNLMVSFYLACSERMNGELQSGAFSPRLSVWKKSGDAFQCIAYGDFNQA